MTSSTESLPILHVKGTHYEVGLVIGKTFKDRIRSFFYGYDSLEKKFVPFYETETGRDVYNGYLEAATRHFPQYVDELRGMSDGTEIPFHKMFLMQINMELAAILENLAQYECSTVFLNDGENRLICHNEDTHPLVRDFGYVVCAIIEDDAYGGGKHKKRRESFKAYSYPGSLPGRAMGFNESGFVVTINALYPKRVPLSKTPRVFLNRALLSAECLEDVRAIVADEGIGCATGFSANIGMFKGSKRAMWNIEVAPPDANATMSKVSELLVSEFVGKEDNNNEAGKEYAKYYHFNMYDHFDDIEERPGTRTSSVRRKAAAEKHSSPMERKGVFDVVGDDSDSEYPIFRRPSKTDPGMTVATGLFDMEKGTWEVFLDNPKQSACWISPISF